MLASGGTALAALVFLAAGIGSLAVRNGVFSAGIGAMLLVYGLIVLGVAWAAWRGQGWANGAMVASSLLHLLVGASTARGSHQPWMWAFAAVALVTLLAAGRLHLAELRRR